MNQDDRRKYLIKGLLKERPEYENMQIPSDAGEQKMLLRSLMNIRMPRKMDHAFLQIQDAYLSEENEKKGIVTLADIREVQPDLSIWKGDITRLRVGAIVNAANSGMTGCYQPCHNCIDNCIHTDKVKTYTFGLGVKKVDKATQEELDGAVFTLTKKGESTPIKFVKVSDDEYRVATDKDTDTVTDIAVNSKSGHNPVIKGLNEGDYILHEKTAPDKYSVVPDITVTIKANKNDEGKYTGAATISVSSGKLQDGTKPADQNNKVTVTDGNVNINVYVEDTKGISLPETGSKTAMYCLYAGALLVVLGAAFFGITSRKKNK